jgi:hypothetical protein
MPFVQNRSTRDCGDVDLIQLNRKIKNGELSELKVRLSEIIAIDRAGKCEYRSYVTNESSKNEILQSAREHDTNGVQRVPTIEGDTAQPSLGLFRIGFVALFAVHGITILLMLALLPLYVVLAVRNESPDQNTKIIWVVLICTMGMFAMPVYWYLHVWRQPAPDSSVVGS